MIRAPVMPNGWPRAIAPPNGLSVSSAIPDPPLAGPDRGGEPLVNLDHVDVVDREAGLLQQRLNRRDRAEPHDLRADRGARRADDPRARLEAELLGALVAHH